jgi:toxin ParE1/3/4
MRGKYTKSKHADHDIRTIIIRSMADFGEAQTDKYIEGLESALCELAEAPGKGRPFVGDRTGQEYSRYRYVSHVIYYRKRQNDIFIVRILHEKMLPENHL